MSESTAIAPASAFCEAKTRPGAKYPVCHRPAGWGTDHAGVGRCKLHGGRAAVRHGRYSTVKRAAIRELIEHHAADPDPLDILPELAAARALFQDFIERYDEWRDALLAWHASFSDEYREELAAARAEWDEATHGPFLPPEPIPVRPHQVLDIGDAYRILSEVTKIAKRIEDVRAANAITLDQLRRFLYGVQNVIEQHVPDAATRERIRHDLLSLRP